MKGREEEDEGEGIWKMHIWRRGALRQSHLATVYGVFKAALQTLVMVRVKVT